MAIFEEIGSNPIFKNKSVFSKDYVPKSILHRDEQITQIADGLRYILQGQRPTDQMIHGKRGTGKTLVARHVADELVKATSEVKIFYVSLKHARTEFMALGMIIDKIIGKGIRGKSLTKGNSFHDGSTLLFDYISELNEKYIILILDEINKIENPDMLLHTLLRPHEVYYRDLKGKEISYIFISNDPKWPRELSEGTKSSYTGVTKRVFPIYDADALRGILGERVQEGLMPGVCDDGIIAVCAAYGAQEDGDARETIQLLGKAAEIAVENKAGVISNEHVKLAREQVDFDGLAEVMKTLPTQLKSTALACIWDTKYNKTQNYVSTTGSVYNAYKDIVRRIGIDVLTQRRVTDLLTELAGMGFIDTTIMSKGRYGRTKEINLITSFEMENVILDDYRLKSLKDYRPQPHK